MKKTSANLKLIARERLAGQYGTPMAALLLLGMCTILPSMLISSIMNTNSVMSIITSQILVYIVSLIISIVNAGYCKLVLNMNRREPFAVKDLFFAFSHHPDRFIIVHLILLAVQFVVCLPFDLPFYLNSGNLSTSAVAMSLLSLLTGSIVSTLLGLFFGLADYILIDHTDMSALGSMKESLRLMKGNKGRLLYIYFSFLPLSILSIFTCYIGFLWVAPYMRTTLAVFYMDVAGELDTEEEADLGV